MFIYIHTRVNTYLCVYISTYIYVSTCLYIHLHVVVVPKRSEYVFMYSGVYQYYTMCTVELHVYIYTRKCIHNIMQHVFISQKFQYL